MIFQHTIDNVLNGTKTQTSRIWKDNYLALYDYYERDIMAIESQTGRFIYRVGKAIAVQPARGKHSVARIKITALAKRMIHTFADDDIAREGFANRAEFLKVWREMHGAEQCALVIRFELVQP